VVSKVFKKLTEGKGQLNCKLGKKAELKEKGFVEQDLWILTWFKVQIVNETTCADETGKRKLNLEKNFNIFTWMDAKRLRVEPEKKMKVSPLTIC